MSMEQMDLMQPRRIPAGCTKKEYRRSYASPELYKQLKTWAIVGYVLCGINVALGLFVNVFALFDAALLGGLVAGMHLKRSKGCAVAILAYSIFGAVISLISGGSITGWMWIALSVAAMSIFKKMDGEYAELTANQ